MTDKPYNKQLARLRLAAVYAGVLALLALARPRPIDVSVGIAIMVIGEAIRVWAAGHLRKTVQLITSGPYRYTRNPLYLGRLLIFTGVGVMAHLPYGLNAAVLAIGWAIFFGYYLRRKERVEPARLRQLHGDRYEAYFRAVPALFPNGRSYAATEPSPWSSERLLRNREHLMLLALSAVALWMLWRAYNP